MLGRLRYKEFIISAVSNFSTGGPLMYFNKSVSSYTLIGTYLGGYSCIEDRMYPSEGSDNGIWNKVSAQVAWIKNISKDMGEKPCSI